MPPVEAAEDGVRLVLHVQPRASRTELVGIHGDALKLRVAALPSEGAANLELLRFLARRLEVPPASVELIAGPASRRKTVFVRGLSLDAARRKLGLPEGSVP